MSEDNSWLLQTIVAKSDQLNAVDLVGGPITVTIEKVKQTGSKEQPIAIYYTGSGERPYKPCLSMRRVLIACWGIQSWNGRQMTLYPDARVTWSGKAVGGIRISHLSHLDADKKEIQINESRNKKTTWTVERIATSETTKPETKVETIQDRVTKATKKIAGCKTADELAKCWELCQPLYAACDDDQKNVLSSAKTEQEEVINGN